MDPLDFLKSKELLRFFHYKKTQMSCMERPHTFLSQLRDHDLIPEDRYQMVRQMKSKDKIKKAIYDILYWFERERSQDIHAFWRCVFNKIIMDQYPMLGQLYKSLMDGSFHFDTQLSETVEKKWTDEKKRKELSENDEEKSENEKKKQKSSSVFDSDEEQCGPSSQLSPDSPLKKQEKNDVWASSIFKFQLPVTCGDLQGSLNKDRLAKGEECIFFQNRWFTPSEFEKLAGRKCAKNWKLSIRCNGTPLGKLIKDGHLKSVKYKGGCKRTKNPPCPSDQAITGKEETEKQTEQQQETDNDSSYIVFKVTCEDIRFQSGTCEKSIHSETSWMSPEEAVKEASCQTDASCKTEIKSEEQPRSVLTEISEKKQELSGNEEENSGKKKKKKHKQRSESTRDSNEEQPGPSTQLISGPRNKSPPPHNSPLKKDENDVWASSTFKFQLPVTCGDLEGSLNKDRLAKGEECILFQNRWFTPSEFEKLAGRKCARNWKLTIRCNGTPLGKLIKDGHLKSVKYKGGCKRTKNPPCPSDQAITDKEETDETEDCDCSGTEFRVVCGAQAGTLHIKRFASGTCGKSIRTETSWMSPVEFVKEASGQADASWKKDIRWQGNPLNVLIEKRILMIHSPLCDCKNCQPDPTELDDQRNDDECFVCKRDEDPDLVECDHCPRSFHQKCHLPHIEDAILRDNKPWMCTICNFKSYKYSERLEMQAAMSQHLSRHMLKCQYLLLYLCSADEGQTSASNPNPQVQNSSSVIQTPMRFGEVAEKLQKKEYQTVGEFVSDIQLIFTNCATHNQDDAELLHRGSRLKELFDREFKEVFNIVK